MERCIIVLCLLITMICAEAQDPFSSSSQEQDYNKTMLWGTYRPNVYFGMKTRSKSPFNVGLMWQSLDDLNIEESANQFYRPGSWFGSAAKDLRHTCEQGDRFSRYGWTHHDGTRYGNQELYDSPYNVAITTQVIKDVKGEHGGHWAFRIEGEAIENKGQDQSVSLFMYFSTEEETSNLDLVQKGQRKGINPAHVHLKGNSAELGEFSIFLKEEGNDSPKTAKSLSKVKALPDLGKVHFNGYSLPSNDVWRVKDVVQSTLKKGHSKMMQEVSKEKAKQNEKKPKKDSQDNTLSTHLLVPTLDNSAEENPNLYVLQRVVKLPFKLEVVFVSHSAFGGAGKQHSKAISEYVDLLSGSALTTQFEQARNDFEVKFEETFQLDKKGYTKEQQKFAMSALSNMVGGMGYFYGNSIVQIDDSPRFAPPASLFTAVPSRPFFPRGFLWDEGFHELLISQWNTDITVDVVKHWYNLMDWDGWIAREQILGEEARSKVPREFQVQFPIYANPPTLFLVVNKIYQKTLHDPEAAVKYTPFLKQIFPALERHFQWFQSTQNGIVSNSYRWRGRTVNHTLTSGLDDYPRANPPSDNEMHIDLLCWMTMAAKVLKELSAVANKDASKYQQKYENLLKELNSVYWNQAEGAYNDVLYSTSGNTFVNHKGYISLFPLLLGLIPKESEQLQKTLNAMKDPQQLWSPYGIRSLSKSDAYFGHGEDYWKGPIWININYLIVSSLYKNYINDGPYKAEAKQLYTDLRNNLVQNIFENYKNTGFIWEQYHPLTGKGQRSHPFTGWSALVVLMMSEMY